MENFFNWLVEQYGIYAVFILCMVEGDITLLLSGVLAQNGAFGKWSYLQVVLFGTAGAVTGDFIGYLIGRFFQKNVEQYSFYRAAKPRIESLTAKFGVLSIFVSKYIYGIRAAWCIFYGVSGTPWWKFLMHDTISCFLWVLVTSGLGYFFGATITGLIGEFKQVSIALLVILVCAGIGFYLFERYYVSKKVEQIDPETIQGLENAAHTTLHDIKEGINERLHLTAHNGNSAINKGSLPEIPPTKKTQNAESE